MSRQIIKQPNGLYAQWSSVVDDFVMTDATPEDIIEDWTNMGIKGARHKVSRIVSSLNSGGKPYYQFTMSYQQAIDCIEGAN